MILKFFTKSITPALAAEWLTKLHPSQRKFKVTVAEKYARDMINGNWPLTPEPLVFDKDGLLSNGMHRLNAVIMSGKTIEFTVCTGAPSTTINHIDTGVSRTVVDVLKIRGVSVSGDAIAIARAMEATKNPDLMRNSLSPDDAQMLLTKHEAAITFVLGHIGKKISHITTAHVLAAVGLAYYNETDKDKLSDFMKLLISGVAQDPHRDSTVIAFREQLRAFHRSGASAYSRIDICLRTQRVIQAYMHDERLNKIYTPTMSVYLLPYVTDEVR